MTSRKLLRPALLLLLLPALAAGVHPAPLSAAALDVLDKQRQTQPEPKSQPPLRVTEEGGRPVYDQSLRFTLSSLRVEGATVLTQDELLAPYAALYGKEVSFAAMHRIAAELTKKYRDQGYLLSRVVLPAQELEPLKADVRLVAVEGYIAAIEYVGDEKLAGRLRAYFAGAAQKLLNQRPLRHKDFEREMLLVQDLAGVKVSSRFKEGGERGASILVLTAQPKTISGSLGWDNSGTRSAGPYMVNASLSVAALPLIGAKTTISWTQAENIREYHNIQIAESYQFGGGFLRGLILQGSYAYSDSPEANTDFARQFDYTSESNTASLGLSYPIIRSRDMNLAAGLSFTSRDSSADVLNERFTTDHLRALTATITFDIADEWGGVSQIIPAFTSGLDIFGATDEAWDASNPLAPASYAKFNLYLSRNQQLFGKFSLFAAASAQWADAPLSSYNRFQLGGGQFGRGYEPGVIENDSGAAFTVEPRWTYWLGKTAIQPYIFYDWGKVWSHRDVAGMPGSESLSSVGIGLRLWGHVGQDYLPDFSLGFYAAKGLESVRDRGTDNRCGVQVTLLF